MKTEINYQNLLKLQASLADKLKEGCDRGANILRDNTPIDTKRLWTSTRGGEATTTGLVTQCRIIAGGSVEYGVTRETDIKREVDYAIFVESRTNYARESLNDIKRVILDSLSK